MGGRLVSDRTSDHSLRDGRREDAGADSLLPAGRIVRRAREWRLYDDASRRYTDFWQSGGAALLGHRPRGLAGTVAAEIDRGLWAPAPTAWPHRLQRALTALAERSGMGELTLAPASVRWWPLGPITRESAGGAQAGAQEGAHEGLNHGCRVVLPFPAFPAFPACPASSAEGSTGDLAGTTSPVVLAALVVVAGELLRYLDSPEATARLELAMSLPAPPGFRLDGVYWFPCDDQPRRHRPDQGYRRMRRRALELGIVLPVRDDEPLICPGELGRRERQNWEELCAEWSG
jgi:hypothetical protein